MTFFGLAKQSVFLAIIFQIVTFTPISQGMLARRQAPCPARQAMARVRQAAPRIAAMTNSFYKNYSHSHNNERTQRTPPFGACPTRWHTSIAQKSASWLHYVGLGFLAAYFLSDEARAEQDTQKEAIAIIKDFLKKEKIEAVENIWEQIEALDYEQQDKLITYLMEILLDKNDARNFKPIALIASYCTKIKQKHPEFAQLISQHAQKPKATQFVDTLKQMPLSLLPPLFAARKEQYDKTFAVMGMITWVSYAYNIYRKF